MKIIKIRKKIMKAFEKYLLKVFRFALIFSVLIFATCKQNGNENEILSKREQDEFIITFDVIGEGGKIEAYVDGIEIFSGKKVKKGKIVLFKAFPLDSKYEVDKWTGGVEVATDKGTAKLTVTANADVKVRYKMIEIKIPEGFIAVPVPIEGIVGIDPDYTVSENIPRWKGVFIGGRNIKLNPYAIGKYAVTYELWYKVREWGEKNNYKFENKGREGHDGADGAIPIKENYPVTRMNWNDCIVWCNAYSQMTNGSDDECIYRKSSSDSFVLKDATSADCETAFADMNKKGFRLPTEAEWEYAARYQGGEAVNAVKYGKIYLTKLNSASGAKKPTGFEGLSLPAGETWEALRDETTRVAVYSDWWNGSDYINQDPKIEGTGKVNDKAPNYLGLYNMSGNIWEWCFDIYDNDVSINDNAYRKDGFVTDPQGASAASGNDRVTRGGSWSGDADYVSTGLREKWMPKSRMGVLGFRLVCSMR